MQTLLAHGQPQLLMTQTVFDLDLAMSLHMLAVQSCGHLNYRQKLLCLPPRRNIFLYPNPFVT